MPLSRFLAALLALTVACQCIGVLVADEIVIGNRQDHRHLNQLGIADESDNTRLITAGELWQFFHNQGVTSVDRLTLNVECGGLDSARVGSIGFQIEDPSNGRVLTNLKLNPASNQLEIPLEFDYMKRFSPGSQELIRLDLSDLDVSAQGATVTLNSDGSFFGPFNLVLVLGFLMFWVVVFFVLNRFTRPLAQEQIEDIVVVTKNAEEQNPTTSSSLGNGSSVIRASAANGAAASPRVGHSKMVSAQ